MTSTPHPVHLESFGTHCHKPLCNLADFLPFRCSHCSHQFCSDHRFSYSHSCPHYDEAKEDVRVTLCPLCREPLAVADLQGGREADVNLAMERHLDKGECRALQVNQKGLSLQEAGGGGREMVNRKMEKSKLQCRHVRCTNRMWVEMRCEKCGKPFCPTHREPKHHKCASLATYTTASTAGSIRANTPSPSPSPVAPASSRMTATLSTTSTTVSTSSSSKRSPLVPSSASMASVPSTSTSSSSKSLPNKQIPSLPTPGFSLPKIGEDRTVARRAARERESAALALKNRAKKGLLSEEEKLRYATLQAMEAKGRNGGDGKDCCVS